MLFISIYSRYVPLNYILFFSSQGSGSFQLCCMSQMYQKKSFKSSRGGQSSLKYGGGAILCL